MPRCHLPGGSTEVTRGWGTVCLAELLVWQEFEQVVTAVGTRWDDDDDDDDGGGSSS